MNSQLGAIARTAFLSWGQLLGQFWGPVLAPARGVGMAAARAPHQA